MRTINNSLNADQASKQLKQFAIAGLACSIIGLLAFWWLGIAGLGCCARALILTNHPVNKARKNILQYRLMAIVGILVGIADIALFQLRK